MLWLAGQLRRNQWQCGGGLVEVCESVVVEEARLENYLRAHSTVVVAECVSTGFKLKELVVAGCVSRGFKLKDLVLGVTRNCILFCCDVSHPN